MIDFKDLRIRQIPFEVRAPLVEQIIDVTPTLTPNEKNLLVK